MPLDMRVVTIHSKAIILNEINTFNVIQRQKKIIIDYTRFLAYLSARVASHTLITDTYTVVYTATMLRRS